MYEKEGEGAHRRKCVGELLLFLESGALLQSTSKVPDVLDQIASSGVVIKGRVENFFGNSHSRIFSERGESETLAAACVRYEIIASPLGSASGPAC